jgi:hypothetical protein
MCAAQIWENKFFKKPLSRFYSNYFYNYYSNSFIIYRSAGLDLWHNMLSYGSGCSSIKLLNNLSGVDIREMTNINMNINSNSHYKFQFSNHLLK